MAHRSLGYVIFSRYVHRELKEAYRGIPAKEIGRLKREGAEVMDTETRCHLLASYTGDTRKEVRLVGERRRGTVYRSPI